MIRTTSGFRDCSAAFRPEASTRFAATLCLAALAAVAAAPAADAAPIVLARAIVSPSFSCLDPGCAPVDDIEQGPTGPQHAEGFAIGGFDGAGQATADVVFGAMHLYGHFINQGNAGGFGQNRDDVVITAPGIATGTPGTLTFSVKVSGGIEGATGGGQGQWLLQADFGGGAYDINAFARNDVTNGYVGDPFGIYSATVSFQYGFAAPLDIELTASAISATGGEAVADLTHSLYWMGISDVTANGAPVDTFSAIGASGCDWAPAAVPLPAAGWLLGSGVAGLLGIVRRKAA
jgi:hypothetical protein